MNVPRKIRVLFVCTGNICRSPMAEAVFRQIVAEAGLSDQFEIASAATSTWEIGEMPHPGTRAVLRAHGVPVDPTKRAVQITRRDFSTYDYILVMDDENLHDLRRAGMGPAQKLLEFAPHLGVKDVPDPYYHGNFEQVYALVTAACRGLLQHIREKEGL